MFTVNLYQQGYDIAHLIHILGDRSIENPVDMAQFQLDIAPTYVKDSWLKALHLASFLSNLKPINRISLPNTALVNSRTAITITTTLCSSETNPTKHLVPLRYLNRFNLNFA